MSYDQLDRAQVSVDGKKEIYTALQILILSVDSNFYKPVQLDKSIKLMKVIKKGYLSLYGYRLPNLTTFDGRFLVKLDGTSMEVPNLGFKKIIANYIEDCSEVSLRVKDGDLGKKNMEEIVDLYNACMTKGNPAPVSISSEEALLKTKQLEAIQTLKNKIEVQDFSTKKDALDILRDIESKVDRNENVSNYLLDGLQSTLKDQPAVSEDLNKLIVLFKK